MQTLKRGSSRKELAKAKLFDCAGHSVIEKQASSYEGKPDN